MVFGERREGFRESGFWERRWRLWVGDGVEEKQRRMIVRSSRGVNGFESLFIFTMCVCLGWSEGKKEAALFTSSSALKQSNNGPNCTFCDPEFTCNCNKFSIF